MSNLYNLLEGVLNAIEKGLKEDISDKDLADKFFLSKVHLRRLFNFAFGRTMGAYIRSRKLSASIDELLHTNMNILDIAVGYGLGYEQSYIRTFKREFGLTPGDLRRTGQIVKITPPLHLFDSNRLEDGLIFGPDIVMVPQFHVTGKMYKHSFRDSLVLDPLMAKQFHRSERMNIPNVVNHDVHINFAFEDAADVDYCWFMPAVQVKTLDNIPEGFDGLTFPASLCANFRFIGPGDVELNMAVADGMFKAIDDFMDDEGQKYFLERKRINFEKISSASDDGFFGRWEWYAPVIEKKKIGATKKPDAIIKTYKQEIPALRFIGKNYNEPSGSPPDNSFFDRILEKLDNWRWNYIFAGIEKQLDKEPKTVYDGGDAYVSFFKKKDGALSEYWLGMFMPEGTEVPEGYEMMDFQKSTLGVCRVYGKRNAIIHYDGECWQKLAEEGIVPQKGVTNKAGNACAEWFFQRYNWRGFFEDDRYGKRMLDYCYFV